MRTLIDWFIACALVAAMMVVGAIDLREQAAFERAAAASKLQARAEATAASSAKWRDLTQTAQYMTTFPGEAK